MLFSSTHGLAFDRFVNMARSSFQHAERGEIVEFAPRIHVDAPRLAGDDENGATNLEVTFARLDIVGALAHLLDHLASVHLVDSFDFSDHGFASRFSG